MQPTFNCAIDNSSKIVHRKKRTAHIRAKSNLFRLPFKVYEIVIILKLKVYENLKKITHILEICLKTAPLPKKYRMGSFPIHLKS